ncbi:hypothetical protein Tco_1493700 [Tanacetum coccineum]
MITDGTSDHPIRTIRKSTIASFKQDDSLPQILKMYAQEEVYGFSRRSFAPCSLGSSSDFFVPTQQHKSFPIYQMDVKMAFLKWSLKEGGLCCSARRVSLIHIIQKVYTFWEKLRDKVVRLGINPMIQPEPEDLPKDNPKLERAVLSWILKKKMTLSKTTFMLPMNSLLMLQTIRDQEQRMHVQHPHKHPDLTTDENPSQEGVLLNKLRICFYKQDAAKSSQILGVMNFEALMEVRFQMRYSMGGSLFFLGLQANRNQMEQPIETQKPLVKDEEASDVIPVACSRFQVPGSLTSDSDYAGANLDRKTTTEVSIPWQETSFLGKCKKQTIGYFTTEAEYGCCLQCCSVMVISSVSTDMAELVTRWAKYSTTAIETLKKIPPMNKVVIETVSLKLGFLNLYKPISIAQFTLRNHSHIRSFIQALITLSPTITSFEYNWLFLEFVPNAQSGSAYFMVTYLEKTDRNAEFHEIIDFLARSSIHNALTVSPIVSITFVEQFWMSAKSKIINNVRYITTKVVRKPVSIYEASIRSDLLFDDADGIDSLPNQAIFDAIQLMGYEGDLTVLTFNKALFSPQWRFLFHTMNHCISSKSTYWDQIPTNIATAVICLTSNQKYNFSKLIFDGMLRHLDAKKKFVMYPRFISVFLDTQLKSVPVPLDYFPVNALTSKVFSFMVKKGKHFSGKVTPLFSNMLVQPTEDEGEQSERPSEP